MSEKKMLYVAKIKDGTVIDHITAGQAMNVAKILGIGERSNTVVTIAMNVPSKNFGKKDMVKIEGRELNPEEVDKIALLAPHATINIIRNYEVKGKKEVKLPKIVKGIIKCVNPACISNSNEPVQPIFYMEREEPLSVKCHYCGYIMEKQEILKQF
jgi:aspartate carbamoyltransferase regulatory subunit